MATQLMTKHRRGSKSDRNALLTKAARNKENQHNGVFGFKVKRGSKIRLRLNWNQEKLYHSQFGSPEMYYNYDTSPSGYFSPDFGDDSPNLTYFYHSSSQYGVPSADCDDMMID
jgi:hypothetical protein